jgi:hypothetical protein
METNHLWTRAIWSAYALNLDLAGQHPVTRYCPSRITKQSARRRAESRRAARARLLRVGSRERAFFGAPDLAATAAVPSPRNASTARRAGSARPRIIRRRVISRHGIGRRRVIGRRPVTHVVEGRRPRERSERRGDDCRGGNGYGARRADRPG